MANRIKKYNPAFLPPEELVRTFVVRHAELDLIMQVIRENVTQSNQHIIVIGPRGIGKTMLVLRVVEEIQGNEDLLGRWYPLVFGEESYQVSTPGEFWLEALFHLAHKTGAQQWRQTYEELRDEPDEEQLRERALAQLMDFADVGGKRILFVVENFNMLLGDQISDSDAWKLRHTLLNEPRVMLLATATSRFEEIENADKAMFDMFKLYELGPLDEKECGTLWALISEKEASDERVRPLQILTGGSPRLLVIISNFAARMSLKELMDDLMQLVDDNTEYFKSHLDSLPAIERKVYLALAELWDPVTAREVATFARLNVNKASSLLRRLIARGMVMEADGKRRAKLYQVSERMYNIYYLMRRRGAPSRRVKALVRFMVPFYGSEELVSLTKRIAEEACKLEASDRKDHYLAYEGILESISTGELREKLVEAAPSHFFRMADIPTSLKGLADERLLALLKEADALGEKPDRLEEAEHVYRKATEIAPENEMTWTKLGLFLSKRSERYDEAERALRRACKLRPESADSYLLLGSFLCERLNRYEEAEKLYRKAIQVRPDHPEAYGLLGELLCVFLNRYDEAAKVCQKATELKPDDAGNWAYLGLSLSIRAGCYEEAEKAFRKSTELKTDDHWTWEVFGRFLHRKLKRYDEAEKAYRRAIEIGSDCHSIWLYLGELLLENLHRYEEAEQACRKAIELKPDYAQAWARLGQLLHEKLGRYEEAEEAYRRAIELGPEVGWGHAKLGQLLHKIGRYEEAERAYRKSIDIDKKDAWTWAHLGQLLYMDISRPDEAEEACRKAIELDPEYPCPWVYLGGILRERGCYEEAERAYRKAIEKGLDCAYTWGELGRLLHENLDRYEEAESAYRRAIQLEPSHQLAWYGLIVLLLEKLERPRDAWQLAEKCLAEHPKEARLRNTLAWAFYKHGPRGLLTKAKVWAEEVLAMEPSNASYQHTVASILCALGKGTEALEYARSYVEDTNTVKKTVDDAIDLFVGLAASGVGKEALKILRDSASAEILEPLAVGLRMYVGEDVKAAAEIMEVGKDVVKRIKERSKEIKA